MKSIREYKTLPNKKITFNGFSVKYKRSLYLSIAILTPKRLFKTSVMRHKIKNIMYNLIQSNITKPYALIVYVAQNPTIDAIYTFIKYLNHKH